MHPAWLVLWSFVAVILLGYLLLSLPFATTGEADRTDLLFTAVSAVCVTGLVVLDTGSDFTGFGQAVILVLIQIGGLGLMTFSVVLFRWIGRGISHKHRLVMQNLFSQTPRRDIYSLVRGILQLTAAVEAVGALLLFFHFLHYFPPKQAAWTAVFHSVSAFCNAGFSLYPDSMSRWAGSFLLNGSMMGLIIVGGLGFPVLYELRGKLRGTARRMSVQTRTVLITSAVLIVAPAVIFALIERQALADMAWRQRLLAPVFQVVTCRTAGFNTIDLGSLSDATLAMMMALMFIGASPGSCGGGVKTTTLAVLTAFTASRAARKKRVNMFKKSIPEETVFRTVSLVLLGLAVAGVTFFLLLAREELRHAALGTAHPFLPLLFETFSAFGTVGLSLGVTASLSLWSKCWIMALMLVGRVGILSFAYIIAGGGAQRGLEYAEENVMIG